MSRDLVGRFLPQMKPLSKKRPTVISVLDIGSSKVCCIIGRLTPCVVGELLPGRSHDIEVIGVGLQAARGIKSGVIVDLQNAEKSIRLAVDAAERMAGVTVESLLVNVSSGRLTSEAFSTEIELGDRPIQPSDVSQLLQLGAEHALKPDRSVVHSLPIGYSLDGEHGIANPCNLFGSRLGVDMHVVTAENTPLNNVELAINRSHLSVEAMVATPYASGLAALVEDEAELGVACIDMGAGTTTISVSVGGNFVYADALAIGSHHITMDLARGLSCRMEDAEKIKVLYGSALTGSRDHEATVNVPMIGDASGEQGQQVARARLTRIILPRVEEILELIRGRLARSGFGGAIGKRIVLTGGGSQLNGICEVSKRILGQKVRVGRPMGIKGLPVSAKGPAFSTAVGLLIYPQVAALEKFSSPQNFNNYSDEKRSGGRLSHWGQWLKEGFIGA